MNESQKYIKSAGASFPKVTSVVSNIPTQYADRRRQYLADRRALFDEARDYLATDFVKARVQGLDPNDFFAWTETEIRLSDVSTQSVTAFDSKQYDDFKEILFRSRAYDYIPVGAYIETMGSIWMVVNPGNMSSATTNAVIARCRAHWTFYDEYGNIKWEPLVIDRRTMLSNRNESPENLVMMEGYFNVKCQKNANTIKLRDNQRMILGSYAYHITGYTDFFEEFTGDDDSAHVINFTVRREEPEEHDDLVNHIADGNLYEWSGEIIGPSTLNLHSHEQYHANLLLNSERVSASATLPMKWNWSVSDNRILGVSSVGVISGASEGTADVIATLEQNPNIVARSTITVGSASGEIIFLEPPPDSIKQYSTIRLWVRHLENGEIASGPINWSFSGASEENYTTDVLSNGHICEITCNSASTEPLVVRATAGSATTTITIFLVGY